MINLKHLWHIVTWGYSVALLNVTSMLHLKTMLPDCNIHLTKQTPTQAFRGWLGVNRCLGWEGVLPPTFTVRSLTCSTHWV